MRWPTPKHDIGDHVRYRYEAQRDRAGEVIHIAIRKSRLCDTPRVGYVVMREGVRRHDHIAERDIITEPASKGGQHE